MTRGVAALPMAFVVERCGIVDPPRSPGLAHGRALDPRDGAGRSDGRAWLDRVGKLTCDLPDSAPVAQFDPNESVWFDDALPPGAQGGGNWTWDTAVKASGTKSHGETPAGGIVERYFQNATATITAGLSDTLVT